MSGPADQTPPSEQGPPTPGTAEVIGQALGAAAQKAGLDPSADASTGHVVWKAMGGTLVPLTVGLALDVAKAAKVQEAQVFAAAEAHRAAIYASDDPNSYDYLSGWPDIYRGGDET